MLYIKKHPEVLEESILTESTETDILDISYEIDLECAQMAFESTHALIDTYVAEMSEDSFKDAKNNKESGNVEDADFKQVEDNGKAPEANKTLSQKIKAFIGKVIAKIKELFTRFVNWVTTKILSNDKFIARFKDQKLGKIKAEAYDYANGFNNIKNAYAKVRKAFDVSKAAYNEILTNGKHTENDELKGIIDDAKEKIENMFAGSGEDLNQLKKNAEDTNKNIIAGFKKTLIGDKVERTLDGAQLLKILTANKDIKNDLQKVTVGCIESIKYSLKMAEAGESGKTPLNTRIFINWSVNMNARLVQVAVSAAQELIVGIRNHINKCANAGDEPEVVK